MTDTAGATGPETATLGRRDASPLRALARPLLIVNPNSGETVRRLSPRLTECLCAAKEDWNAAPRPVRRAARRTLASIHRNRLRIRCGCREEENPVLGVRRNSPGRYVTFNLPTEKLEHADDCVFRRGAVRATRWIAGGNADLLDLFPRRASPDGEPDPDADRRPSGGGAGISRGPNRKTVSYAVRKLLQRARLNRLEVADRHPQTRRWLDEIESAAASLRVAPDVRASDFLFTDPERWRAGEVHECLDAAARKRRRTDRPFAMLCWPAREASDDEVDPHDRLGGYVKVRSHIIRPVTGRHPVRGPYLFLGAVARPEDGDGDGDGWDCLEACLQPIAALDCPIPVESGYERAAVAPLRAMARRLRDSPLLNEALGGAVRVEIEKPLTPIEVRGGPCLPDFRLTVVRPGARDDLPGGPGHPRNRAAFDPRDRARYIVEAMGRNDPEYEDRKERTHARMARLGHVFRIEAGDFEAGGDSLERRCRDIAGEIERDLVRRWTAG